MDLPDLHVERGEAAFYGPKADFVVADCIGREWQLGTVQLDYNLPSPQRFGLEYIGADNHPHQPVMIHRAPFGSFERFVGMLIEHFAGAFPLWLAPEQVRVMVVSQKVEEYGRSVERQAAAAGFRVTGDYRAGKDRLEDPRRPIGADPLHVRRRRPRGGGRARWPCATASKAILGPCRWPPPSTGSRPKSAIRRCGREEMTNDAI